MKKFFIALSVLAALLLGVAPSQALVGMPDDVPGADAVIPFICSTDITTGTGLNTLIAFTEVGGVTGVKPAATNTDFNFRYDVMQQIYKLNLFLTVLKKNVKNMTIKQYYIKIVQSYPFLLRHDLKLFYSFCIHLFSNL